MTFADLHRVATEQMTQHTNGDPIDLNDTSDALTVAAALFDWIAANATDAQKIEIAQQVEKALGL